MLNKAAAPRENDHIPDVRAELLARLDEAALLRGVLRRDPMAWREFVRRYEPVMRRQIGRVLSCRKDITDEVMSDVYLRLLDKNMRKLRAFDRSRGATLGTWLGMVACDAARRRRTGANRNRRQYVDIDRANIDGTDRGGRWIGIEREA